MTVHDHMKIVEQGLFYVFSFVKLVLLMNSLHKFISIFQHSCSLMSHRFFLFVFVVAEKGSDDIASIDWLEFLSISTHSNA